MKKLAQRLIFRILLSHRVAIGLCIGALFHDPKNWILWAGAAINCYVLLRDERAE